VIADLKTIAVELRDLLPRQVILFVRCERKSFGDEKRRAEAVLFQERSNYRVVTGLRVV
jgi:hypothetical protein